MALTSSVSRRSGLRLANTLTLEVPRTRLSFSDRTFSVAGARARNSLPINVRNAQSMFSLRKLLRTFLFQRAHSWLNSCFNIVRTCSIFCVRRLKFVIFTLHYHYNQDIVCNTPLGSRYHLQHTTIIKMCMNVAIYAFSLLIICGTKSAIYV